MKYLHKIFYTRKATIIKCDDPFLWYYNMIGKTFIVERFKKEHWMLDDSYKNNYVTTTNINGFNKGYIKKNDVKTFLNF